MSAAIKIVGVVGAGLIGSGWAARCLAHGYDVVAQDSNPAAETGLRAMIERVRPLLAKAYGEPAKTLVSRYFRRDLDPSA